MLRERELVDDGRGAERDVVAVADVDHRPRELLARCGAAHAGAGFDEQGAQTGAGEVRRTHEAVVPCSDDDDVVIVGTHATILAGRWAVGCNVRT